LPLLYLEGEQILIERVAENGRLWELLSAPPSTGLICAPSRFNHFLGFSRQAFQGVRASTADLLTFPTSFLALPHFFRGVYFGSSSSLPKVGFSPIYLQLLTRSIYGTVFPTGLRPCLPPACIRKHNWTAYRMGSTIRLWCCRAHFKVTITMSISFRCNDCTRRRQ
jgi:hypothetical protein